MTGRPRTRALSHRTKRFISSVLADRTDGALYVRDYVAFAARNDPMLRINFLKSKSDRLAHQAALHTAPETEVIDLSDGRSSFGLPNAACDSARALLVDRRQGFAQAMATYLAGSLAMDPEYFHYIDLHVSGFPGIAAPLCEALGVSSSVLDAAGTRFFLPEKRLAQGRVERLLRDRLSSLARISLDDVHLGLSAGSSVYLSVFLLETVMRPGASLLAPDYTFHGTLNCVLPLFQAGAAAAPSCSMVHLPVRHTQVCAKDLENALAVFRSAGADFAAGPPGNALWLTHPTTLGSLYTPSSLEEIAAVCQRSGLPVICDEIYAGLGNFQTYQSPLAVAGFGDQLITVGTTSKLFSLYDGDHLRYTPVGAIDGVLTEDVNTWSGGVSYFLTRNTRWADAINRRLEQHPFTLTRLLFAEAVLANLGEGEMRSRDAAYAEMRQTALQAAEGLRRTLAEEGSPDAVTVLATPQAGYFLGLRFSPDFLWGSGIKDAAQLAAYVAVRAGVRTGVVPSASEPDLIGLRINFAAPRGEVEAAFARLGAALLTLRQDARAGAAYSARLPRDVREMASETFEVRRLRYLSPG